MEKCESVRKIVDNNWHDDEMLIIPNGVTRIFQGQFSGNCEVVYAEIPDGVVSIEEEAFADCESLEWVRVPESVEYIGRYAFNNCEKLRGVVVPHKVKKLGFDDGSSYPDAGDEGIFENCKSLRKVILPSELESIGQEIFKNCISLYDIIIPDSVRCIGQSAFERCDALEIVSIPPSVREIKSSAFKDCVTLREVDLSDCNFLTVGSRVFEGCVNLKIVKTGTSELSVSSYAFAGCKALRQIHLNGSHFNYKAIGLFNNCSPEIEISWDMVKKVNGLILEGDRWQYINSCLSCSSITIPASVEWLGRNSEDGGSFGNRRNAFDDCDSLERVIIPGHVRSVGVGSFRNCTKLKVVEILSSRTKMCGMSFEGCEALEAIYVPKGCKQNVMHQLREGVLKSMDTLVQERP